MSGTISEEFGKLIRGSGVIFLGNLIGAGSAFLTRVVAARHLGPTDYGLVILGISTLNILSLFALFGLPEGLARVISRSDDSNGNLVPPLAFSIGLSIAGSIIVILSPDLLSSAFSEPGLKYVLPVIILALPLRVVSKLSIGILRGVDDAQARTIIQNFSNQGITVLGVVITTWIGLGIIGVLSAWIVAYAISVIVSLFFVFKRKQEIPKLSHKLKIRGIRAPHIKGAKPLLVFSFPLMASEGMWLLIQEADSFVIAYYLSSGLVGVYDSAYTIGRLLLLFVWAPTFLFLPLFSRLHNKKEQQKMDRIYKLTTKWMGFISLPIFLILFILPRQVIGVAFGIEYVTSSLTLSILALGFFSHIILGLSREAITAIGDTWKILKGNSIGMILNILLNLLLVPRLGILGAALASSASFILVNIYWIMVLFKSCHVQPIYGEYVKPFLTAMGVNSLILVLSRPFIGSDSLSLVALLIVISILTLVVIVLTGGIENEEREMIRRLNLPKSLNNIVNFIEKKQNP